MRRSPPAWPRRRTPATRSPGRVSTTTPAPQPRSPRAPPLPRAAADRLGVGYSTLKRWVLSGRVRTTLTAGGHHRVSESEIDRLQARQPPSPARRRSAVSPDALDGLSARNQLHGYVDEVRIDGL